MAGPVDPQAQDKIVQAFRRCDLNGDGIIDRDELRPVLEHVFQASKKRAVKSSDIEMMLTAFDTNGDGHIDYEEFVKWATSACNAPLEDVGKGEPVVDVTHVFITPQDEAEMEKETLWKLHKEENNKLLSKAGLEQLDSPALAILSVGSASTQAYDAADLAISVPVGTKVTDESGFKKLTAALKEKAYEQVVMINSIGYLLKETDPNLVALDTLASRVGEVSVAHGLWKALEEALPKAKLFVYNRAKAQNKRYLYPQLQNDWTESLALGHKLAKLQSQDTRPFDVIVDWGGASFKVYSGGKRIGTEPMDANGTLCSGDTLHSDLHQKALRDIERYVQASVPQARHVLIAQTGLAREIALRTSCIQPTTKCALGA
mmetsp:Transcript_60563/g.136265  ORF Transcript_60563/g.136265 Transcript_60563/m.136265 type:complete len:374 (+) Transcript_60563:64-1185(+)